METKLGDHPFFNENWRLWKNKRVQIFGSNRISDTGTKWTFLTSAKFEKSKNKSRGNLF